ncbi:MAG: serine/threonine protein kinase [Ramlibacter sp.]
MANQEQSRNGVPHKDQDRPSPDVGRGGTDSPSAQDYRGDGPAKHGLTSDQQPDLVAPSGVNERDAGDSPVGGGALDFDDGTDMVHPRGKVTGSGRTWDEKNPSDAGDLGAPNAGLSDRNGPSDPDAKRSR